MLFIFLKNKYYIYIYIYIYIIMNVLETIVDELNYGSTNISVTKEQIISLKKDDNYYYMLFNLNNINLDYKNIFYESPHYDKNHMQIL